MKPDRPPLIILSGIRWNFLWQRHQILATRFARAGYKTVFVETTGLSNPKLDGATLRKVSDRLPKFGRHGPKASARAEPDCLLAAHRATNPTGFPFP